MKKTALITGGSRGIGKAIAEKFRQNNIEVITPSRFELDLSSSASITNFLKKISSKKIDILVNNAGINHVALLPDLSEAQIHEMTQINVIAPMQLVKGISPQMIKNNYGRIINISSIWSQISKAGRAVYSANKSAINGFTRTAAIELAPHNILVNAVAPGYVDTDLTRKNNSPEEIEKIAKNIPAQRLAKPEEIAELVLFLASEKNTYLTGQTIFIDGGFSCQ